MAKTVKSKPSKPMTTIETTAEAIEGAVLTEAYAVNLAKESGKSGTELLPISSELIQKPLAEKSPAEWAYERIVLYIKNFEEQLDSEHEVGMGFVGGHVGTLKIQGMGYFAPDIITFFGEDGEGAKMQLVQHVGQLNVMLVSAPKDEEAPEPNRIGFKLAKELTEKNEKAAKKAKK